MRNFWIEAYIDGRKTMLQGGPRSKDGGFNLQIFMRDQGNSVSVLCVTGRAIGNELILETSDKVVRSKR